MNIVFRVDSSSHIGAGHLMRCITLADELRRKKHQITFVCRELEGNLTLSINYPVLMLKKNNDFQSEDVSLRFLGVTQIQDAAQTIKVIPKNVDLLIVDNYALDKTWHKQLRLHVKKIMVIDDLANKQFDCDVLLNQNLGSQKKDYQNKVPNDCELLLGCDYALLRPEFSQFRGPALEKRKNTKEIKNILVSMGGSDNNNVTYEVLQQLDDNFNVVVVLGKASKHKEMIKHYAKDKNIEIIVAVENMAELMLNADLAIGAGGSTSWERCCLGLPTLLYVTSENQKKVAKCLEKLGAVLIVKNLKDDLQSITDSLIYWRNVSEKAQVICDGMGVKRIKL